MTVFQMPFDVSHRWSTVTMRISCTVSQIYSLFYSYTQNSTSQNHTVSDVSTIICRLYTP